MCVLFGNYCNIMVIYKRTMLLPYQPLQRISRDFPVRWQITNTTRAKNKKQTSCWKTVTLLMRAQTSLSITDAQLDLRDNVLCKCDTVTHDAKRESSTTSCYIKQMRIKWIVSAQVTDVTQAETVLQYRACTVKHNNWNIPFPLSKENHNIGS